MAPESGTRFGSYEVGLQRPHGDELASWITAVRGNERVELVVELELGRRLAADPASPLHREAQRAAEAPTRRISMWMALGSSGALAAVLEQTSRRL